MSARFDDLELIEVLNNIEVLNKRAVLEKKKTEKFN